MSVEASSVRQECVDLVVGLDWIDSFRAVVPDVYFALIMIYAVIDEYNLNNKCEYMPRRWPCQLINKQGRVYACNDQETEERTATTTPSPSASPTLNPLR
jgi:hypothetical protein